jgi:hypothetical protein
LTLEKRAEDRGSIERVEMEHPTPPPAGSEPSPYSPSVRGIAVASTALGFFSMIVFWWKPFGLMLASVGLVLGVISLMMGNSGSLRGEENLARAGTAICVFSLTVITTIYFSIGYLTWGFAPW